MGDENEVDPEVLLAALRAVAPDQVVRETFRQLFDAIDACMARRLHIPAIALTYIAIDTAGWLDTDADEGSGDTFVSWANQYVLRCEVFACTALDLWAARCAVVHTSAGQGQKTRSGKGRPIFYSVRPERPGDLQGLLDKQGRDEVVVPLDELILAVRRGVECCLRGAWSHPQACARVQRKARIQFSHMPDWLIQHALKHDLDG